MTDKLAFWQTKTLAQMTEAEWESLCDGCGKCCLVKLQEPDSEEVVETDVACQLLDPDRCRCRNYAQRHRVVPDCIKLTPENLSTLNFLPSSCAYRLLHSAQSLPWWHPLVSGDPDLIHRLGLSCQGRVVSETEVADADLEDHIVVWPCALS